MSFGVLPQLQLAQVWLPVIQLQHYGISNSFQLTDGVPHDVPISFAYSGATRQFFEQVIDLVQAHVEVLQVVVQVG